MLRRGFIIYYKVIAFFGSVSLFIFGVKFLGEGLESLSRSKFKEDYDILNKSKYRSILIGILLTIVVQFSSITTIMTVGLANSGIITLAQALGLIMGANIGTTFKSHVLMFSPKLLIPLCTIIGSYLYVFSKEKRKRELAYVFMGFAITLLGLELLTTSVLGFKDSNLLISMLDSFGREWYMLFILGIAFTILLQSSSALMVILITLAGSGLLDLSSAYYIILGSNIGTTTTTLISSLGTGRNGKRSALMHLLFNVFGSIVWLPFGKYIVNLALSIAPNSHTYQIAIIHTIFNVLTCIILLPFMDKIVSLTKIIIKNKENDVELTRSTILDRRIINTPVFAEQQIANQTLRLANYARINVKLAIDSFIENKNSSFSEIKQNKELIEYLQIQIVDFLVKLSSSEISEDEQSKMQATHIMITDFSKIGELAENIMELANERINKNVPISNEAIGEIKDMYSYVNESINVAIDAYRNSDKNLASTVFDLEKHINNFELTYRESHIKRLNRGKCSPISGIVFLDLISNLERIGDLTTNICESLIKDIAEVK